MDVTPYRSHWRYSRWDGTQSIDLIDPEAAMDQLAESMIDDGDLRSALQRLLRRGLPSDQGQQRAGLRDLIDRLRQQRKDTLDRFNLDSLMSDISQKLEEVVKTEREGIQRRLDEAASPQAGQKPDQSLQKLLKKMASEHQQKLDALPPDPAGQIRELSDYDFMDQQARQMFQDLLKQLQQQMLGNQFEGMKQMLQNLRPEDLQGMRDMVRDLNKMLEQKLSGGQPDFDSFMQKHGQFFPSDVQNLDELIDHLRDRYGDTRLALAAYHAGQGNVDEWLRSGGGIRFPETRAYVESVTSVSRVYAKAYRSELGL